MFLKLTSAVRDLSRSVDRLVAAIEAESTAPMAERGEPALRLSVQTKPGTISGGEPLSLAVAMNNRQQARFTLTPSVVDADGQVLKDENGNPVDPASIPVTWSTTDATVTPLDGIDSDGRSGVIKSGLVGTSEVTAMIGPYPDGSEKAFVIQFAVGNSEPGDPSVAVSVEAEPGT